MKKLISLVLAIAMIISLVPTFALATEAEPQSNIITLFDFGNPDTFGTATYSKNPSSPSALAYEGKDSSLRWEMLLPSSGEVGDTAPELDMTYSETDLSKLPEDSVINVRFYSDAVGSKFNLVYFCNDGIGNVDGVLRSTQNAVKIDGGWQVYSLPLNSILEKYISYADDHVFKVRFNDEGWSNMKNNGYKDGDTVYIDEIWIDTVGDDEAYYANLESKSGNKVIWTSSDGFAAYDNCKLQVKGNGDADRILYTEIKAKATENLVLNTAAHLNSDDSLFDCSDTSSHKYLNAWIYSDYAQDAGINFTLYTGATFARYGIKQLDWKGWKLVSVDLSNVVGTRGKVNGLEIEVDKRKSSAIANPLGKDHDGDGALDMVFGLDGVWVSETSAQAEWEDANAISTTNAVASSSTDLFVKDFNTADALINESTTLGTENTFNASINRYNARNYNTNARLSFESVTWAEINKLDGSTANKLKNIKRGFLGDTTKTSILQIKAPTKDESEWVTVPTSAYVNAWIYNPEAKYTFDGETPADINIAIAYCNNNAHSYSNVAIPVNWVGWKLVSVPFSTWYTSEQKVSNIFIAANYGRIPVTYDSSANKTYPVIRSSKITKLSDSVMMNVFAREKNCTVSNGVVTAKSSGNDNLYANPFAYIDVERFWISSGPVTEELSVNSADNSAIRCSETDGTSVALFTTDADTVGTSSANVIKKSDNTVSKSTASYTDGTVSLGDFEYGATYYANVEIMGTNGVKKHIDFTFTNESIHVSDMVVDGKTATITMHGSLGADYANSLIIAAVYTNNTNNELENAYVGKANTNGTVTVTIPADVDITGKLVRFFFVDSIGNIKPLEMNIQK